MDRIQILEKDLTSVARPISSVTDVVFIPGFSTAAVNAEAAKDDYVIDSSSNNGVPAGYPKLCSTLAEFNAYFGTAPAEFAADQNYPDGFSENALPSTNEEDATSVVMFSSGTKDPSYIMAKELISAGVPVLYERVNSTDSEITVAKMYEALATIFSVDAQGASTSILTDKGGYSVKYLTTGAYPVFELNSNTIAKGMLTLAHDRGDCVAFIDHTNNPGRSLDPTNSTSVFKALNGTYKIEANGEFGTMFTPWVVYDTSWYDEVALPASYGYLITLAKSIKTNANWMAVAGVARGVVVQYKSMLTNERLSNAIADNYQPEDGISLNAITHIKNYGYTLWGNKTLRTNSSTMTESALAYLNLRNLVSDIKKQLYTSAKSLMFEQNTDILWINFKSLVSPLLDKMVTGAGLSGYKLIKETSDKKTQLKATVRIYPIYAVESFEITVELSDGEVSVE